MSTEETTQSLEALEQDAQHVPDQQEFAEPSESENPNVEHKENSKEMNFRAMREAKERAEREAAETRERLERLEQALTQQQKPKPVEEEDDIEIGPDDFVDGRHYRKMASEVKALRKAQQESLQRSHAEMIEIKLKSQYPDFESVVTAGNIQRLRAKYPHIANTLHQSSDLFDKGASAYQLIKELNLADTYQADRTRAQQNAAKPRSITSIAPQQGDRPLEQANAFANGLTPELKQQLLREMQEASKRL